MADKSFGAKDGPPRKMRFAPKIPPRKILKPEPVEPKSEKCEDEALNQELLKRVKEGFARNGPKVEKKSAPVQVAFGYGASQTFTRPSGSLGGPSGSGTIRKEPNFDNSSYRSTSKMEKEYNEPWDYYKVYPVTLPLRRPYSGNPEILNEEEFGEASANFDESSINSAAELGFTETGGDQMIFFQLPCSLPFTKRLASTEDKEAGDDSKMLPRKATLERGCSLGDLPKGFMGKMLVYKSGAVKMKLGDVLFNVTPGMNCIFAQDVGVVHTEEKHFCILGELNKHGVITPDTESLIDAIAD